ncbi:MAG: hemolysin D [Gammaproteobacteria bacterium]|jgi:multidrug efflux system membrane fusion protein|nr:efflux RND transporter periplasmic adaptor subunit [SAR86 cluster bacterium]GIS75428.1 MAG: hemolysin D [Gammaproteobacteria bacterium]GIT61118.1 MAG: hemolysin D [Gammaproteobacteria bacterium]|tara:strand:- start:409 stop:1317 length:909 start_codon:yes stop_codon:yes gene_type:complete
MKIRQTYITSFITLVIAILWMLSGMLADDEFEVKTKTQLETISSVTVLNSTAAEKAKKIKVSGTTEADKLIKIRAEASGTVVSRPVQQGQFVKKDQLICQLYNASRSSYPKVKAPFDGYLETFSVKEGDYLNTGAVCATIIDPDPMRLIGEVSEKEINFVKVGAKAEAELISGKKVEGVVSFVSTSANKGTRTFRVEIDVKNSDRSIRDGVSAQIAIKGDTILAHKISPSILMLGEAGELGIRTVNEDDQVEFKKIDILEDSMEGIWITGLPKNTRIITVGQEYVFQGQTVNVKEISASPEA